MDCFELLVVPVTIDAHVLTISEAQWVWIENSRRFRHEHEEIFFNTLAQHELSLVTQLEVFPQIIGIHSYVRIVKEIEALVQDAKDKVCWVVVIGQFYLTHLRLVLVIVVSDEACVL